jgi:hypothetical protein
LSASIKPIAREVNLLDYVLLEVIHDAAPTVYTDIFRNGRYFYYSEWRLQTWIEKLGFDDDQAARKRNEFYGDFVQSFPSGKRSLIAHVLEELFPTFRLFKEARGFRGARPNQETSERSKKIYHPDYFPVYFISRVPSSQVSEAEFEQFVQSLQHATTIPEIAAAFRGHLESCEGELKRWYFFHLLLLKISELDEIHACGVAIGIAQVSDTLQPLDIFALNESAKTRAIVFSVVQRLADRPDVNAFLGDLIDNSSSPVFASEVLYFTINRNQNGVLTDYRNIDLQRLQERFREYAKTQFPPGEGPRIFAREASKVLPVLFGWRNTGASGEAEVSEYLIGEIAADPNILGRLAWWFFPSQEGVSAENAISLTKLVNGETILALLQRHEGRIATQGQESEAVERMQNALAAMGNAQANHPPSQPE